MKFLGFLSCLVFLCGCATQEERLKPYYDSCFKDWETGICTIHQEKMTKKTVPIVYGLLDFDPFWSEAEIKYFPHADTWIGGGCIIDSDLPKKEKVYICKSCEDARLNWLKWHPQYKGY